VRAVLLLSLSLLFFGAALTTLSRSAEAQTMPPEIAAHVPSNLQPYFVALYITGDEEMSQDIFIAHMAHMRRNFESGALRLAGPLTDDGTIRGVAIIQAPTLEAAQAMTAADPAVLAGVMRVEIHPAMFPELAASTAVYPAAD
jgi:uncharacterized protein YciI